MVSANTSTKQVLAGLKEGANDYIKKPFHQSELTMRIAAHIMTGDRFQSELHVRAPCAEFAGSVPNSISVRLASIVLCSEALCECRAEIFVVLPVAPGGLAADGQMSTPVSGLDTSAWALLEVTCMVMRHSCGMCCTARV